MATKRRPTRVRKQAAAPPVLVPIDQQVGIPRAPAKPFAQQGSSPGVAVISGFLVSGEKDSRLQGRQRYVTFSDVIANTAIVAAGVRFFLNLVAKAKWKVVPADESAEATAKAEQVQGMLFGPNPLLRTPWTTVVKWMALYRFYGFSILEWSAARDADGAIGLGLLAKRTQQSIERWDVSTTGEVMGVVQRSMQTGEYFYIPRSKLVYLVDDSLNDSPEGMGLLRHVVKEAARLDRYLLLEGWGYESDLRGIPIGRAPLTELEKLVSAGTISVEQAAALRAPLEAFIEKHNRNPALGMLLDSAVYTGQGDDKTPINVQQWGIDLLKGEGAPHQQVAAAIERVTRDIARVLGVDHLLLGANDRGSYALSADKSNAFGMTVDATLTEVSAAAARDILGPIWTLNGWDPKIRPSFAVDQAAYRDVESITTALANLSKAGAGVLPNDPAVNAVRDLIGLPHAPHNVLELSLQPQGPYGADRPPPLSAQPPQSPQTPSPKPQPPQNDAQGTRPSPHP